MSRRIITPAAVFVGALIIVACAAAHAQPIRGYSEKRLHNRELLDALYFRTAECMQDSAIAALRNGAQDRAQVYAFALAVCREPMQSFLAREFRLTDKQAQDAIADMAVDMVGNVIDQGSK